MIASFQRQCLAIVHVVPQMLGNEKSLLISMISVDCTSTWMYAIAQILLRMWTYKEGEIVEENIKTCDNPQSLLTVKPIKYVGSYADVVRSRRKKVSFSEDEGSKNCEVNRHKLK